MPPRHSSMASHVAKIVTHGLELQGEAQVRTGGEVFPLHESSWRRNNIPVLLRSRPITWALLSRAGHNLFCEKNYASRFIQREKVNRKSILAGCESMKVCAVIDE